MNIQWYPGHMTKTVRQISEDMKLIDLVIELLDARIAYSSKNPDIERLAAGKMRIILLGKSDMADEAVTKAWSSYYNGCGIRTISIDARQKKDISVVTALINEVCREKRERDLKRGIKNRPVRVMAAGIPNSGKSTFINTFAGRASAKTGNKPGVTRGKQWISVGKAVELLDTPGILWPKFDDETVGLHLAVTGAINDDILPTEELAAELVGIMKTKYPTRLFELYGVDEKASSAEIINGISQSRKLLRAGGEADTARAARLLLTDFRNGRLGRVSLEVPPYTGTENG